MTNRKERTYGLVGSVCWSADRERVLSRSWDGTARVRDVETEETMLDPMKVGHEKVFVAIFSRDTDTTEIVTGGQNEDGVKIWNAKTAELLSTIEHEDLAWSLVWTSDQKYLIVSTSLLDKTVRMWNLDTNLQVGQPLRHEEYVNGAALSPDRKLLVTYCSDKSVYVWDIHTILKDAASRSPLTMRGHTDTVWDVAHLPSRRQIITCSEDGSLRLWNLESGAQIGDEWRDEEEKAGVTIIALSPNGKTVASGGRDGRVKLWDVEGQKVIAKGTGHSDMVESLCWSGDGQRVLSGSDDGTAKVWNVERGQTVLSPIKTGHE
ncbi:WD40 repeat-like protein, partial [Rhizopogon vinicolor AM-OR11-026]